MRFVGNKAHLCFAWQNYNLSRVENLLPICYFNSMAMHLVIDGYNLIGAMADLAGMDLEGIREELLTRLLAYKRLKKHRITVVFDGKRSGNLSRSSMNQKGIEVIFSRDGEEADQILKEMAKNKRQGITLVTSDRAVASFAEAHGAITIPSEEFDSKLAYAGYSDIKGITDEDDEGYASTVKKGNPRRLSKEERKRLKRIKKL